MTWQAAQVWAVALLLCCHMAMSVMPVQALPNWLAELQITNLDVSFCKGCDISVISSMTSLQVLSLQVKFTGAPHAAFQKESMTWSVNCSGALTCAQSFRAMLRGTPAW